MSILAIDTATQVSSVAVLEGSKVLAELTMQARLTHSETLLPHIEQALNMAGITKDKLTGIAVSIGPGSFTGLRIGLAAAKTMAYALSLPIIGVSTLKALAEHFYGAEALIVSMIDAQKGNAYVESYEWQNGELKIVTPVKVAPIGEIIASCAKKTKNVILTGDVVQKKIAGKLELTANVLIAPPHLLMPRAACVAVLGQRELSLGKKDNVMAIEPVYIRRSEAEVLWEKRHPKEAENTKPTEEM